MFFTAVSASESVSETTAVRVKEPVARLALDKSGHITILFTIAVVT
jgi:hypothetical protein